MTTTMAPTSTARSARITLLRVPATRTSGIIARRPDESFAICATLASLRAIGVTPHVTQNQAVIKTVKTRNSAIDERTTRHAAYGMSQLRRAMVECIFGWGNQHGTMRKSKHRGIGRVSPPTSGLI